MNCSCLEGTESHITFEFLLDGVDQTDDVESDTVPPYEDRVGPDGWVEIYIDTLLEFLKKI